MALKIIGPGFGRTGTKSLKIALDQLGFGPCHHMHEVRDNPEQLPAWENAARGGRCDWEAMFSGYVAQVDWPGARYWRELAARYDEAKVILTVRDPELWYDSMSKTIIPLIAGCWNPSRGTLEPYRCMGSRGIGQAGLRRQPPAPQACHSRVRTAYCGCASNCASKAAADHGCARGVESVVFIPRDRCPRHRFPARQYHTQLCEQGMEGCYASPAAVRPSASRSRSPCRAKGACARMRDTVMFGDAFSSFLHSSEAFFNWPR